jgi:hypothetical protein
MGLMDRLDGSQLVSVSLVNIGALLNDPRPTYHSTSSWTSSCKVYTPDITMFCGLTHLEVAPYRQDLGDHLPLTIQGLSWYHPDWNPELKLGRWSERMAPRT